MQDGPRFEDDLAIARAVKDGVPGAFERVMREHKGLCWHILQRMVRHPDDTLELCQETFLRAYRHIGQYRGDSPLKAWLGRIAYSLAVRHLEKQPRHATVSAQVDDGDADDYDTAVDPVDIEALHAEHAAGSRLHEAIERLPPLQRTLLTLYHLDELSIPEIGKITQLPDGTIKSHLFRSRRRLRQLLEQMGETGDE